MGRIEIRYLVKRLRKRGRPCFYWLPTPKLQKAGFIPRRLSDDPVEAARQAEEHNRRLDAWYEGQPISEAHPTNDLRALNALFQCDDGFRDMRERTKRDYLYNIGPALEWTDGIPVSQITTRAIRGWYRAQRDKAGIATSRNRIAALRRLLSFAREEGWIAANPALGLRVKGPASRARVWTLIERDAFCTAALTASRPSMALAVMLGWCLGQRPADLRVLAWTAYDGVAVSLRQEKTGTLVRVRVLPELKRLLDTTPRSSTQVVVSENSGRPYGESDFQHTFAEIRAAAGLPDHLQYRDLRRTFATALGAAGCTDDEIRSLTGHKTRSVVAVYVRPDDRFAKGGMDKLERAGNKS